MSELISIIVPVYNVEKYFRDCLDSIIAQTYRNIEIILVDDGSPDKCGEICDEYSQKDSRIKVLHKENGGVSAARNDGVAACSGEYFTFIDPDDILHPQMVEILYKLLKENNTDISMCNFKIISEDEKVKAQEIKDIDVRVLSKEQFALEFLADYTAPYEIVANKLFRKSMFGQLCFKNRPYEDSVYTVDMLKEGVSCAVTETMLYMYRQRPGSTMTKRNTQRTLEHLEVKKYQYEELKDIYGKDFRIKMFCKNLNVCSRWIAEVYWFMDKADAYRLKKSFWESFYALDKEIVVDKKEKIKFFMFRRLTPLYFMLVKNSL